MEKPNGYLQQRAEFPFNWVQNKLKEYRCSRTRQTRIEEGAGYKTRAISEATDERQSTDCFYTIHSELKTREISSSSERLCLKSLAVLSFHGCLHALASTQSSPLQFQPRHQAEEGAGTALHRHLLGGQWQWETGAHYPFHIPAGTPGWGLRVRASQKSLLEHSATNIGV